VGAMDCLYHIKDYSGHYYRVNMNGQLVVAAHEADAGIFNYVDANRRTTGGGKEQVFYMSSIDEDKNLPAKELPVEEISEPVEKIMAGYDLSEINWMEYLDRFSHIIASIPKYQKGLESALSDVDKKICDVLHYIELCETNSQEAEGLVDLLRVCRENRREIKDELYQVDAFKQTLGTLQNASKAQSGIKLIKKLDMRKYRPRKYTELFENSSMKVKKKKTTEKPVELNIQTEKKEPVIHMIRRDIPYDGMDNNWMSFAYQQREFFQNAEQYAANLQMDIEMLDKRIEEVLMQIEDTNCNAAQGYQMFKSLKELRRMRTDKTRELQCIHALTESLDCTAMMNAFEKSWDLIKELYHGEEPQESGENQLAG